MQVPSNIGRAIIVTGYVILPLAAGILSRSWVAALLGATVAYSVDRFYPRCATGLSERDLQVGLGTFLQNAFNGARVHLFIGGRRLYVFRGEVRGRPALCIQFNRRAWKGLVDGDAEEDLLGPLCDAIMPPIYWRFRSYTSLVIAPERELQAESAQAIVCFFAKRAQVGIESVFARVDYSPIGTQAMFGWRAEKLATRPTTGGRVPS